MARHIHVNGESAWSIAFGGSNLQSLAVCTADGTGISITSHEEGIFTDTFGPAVPFDEQHFLKDATITGTLVFYDEAQLKLLRSLPAGGPNGSAALEGVMDEAGSLWGLEGNYFRLLINSPKASRPYNFPNCRVQDALAVQVGTRRTNVSVTIYAVPYTGQAGSSAGAVLFNTSTS